MSTNFKSQLIFDIFLNIQIVITEEREAGQVKPVTSSSRTTRRRHPVSIPELPKSLPSRRSSLAAVSSGSGALHEGRNPGNGSGQRSVSQGNLGQVNNCMADLGWPPSSIFRKMIDFDKFFARGETNLLYNKGAPYLKILNLPLVKGARG